MNGNKQTRPEATLRDVYRALIRHRKKAVASFLFVMTATVFITLLTPKAYVSQSKLFVRLGRENAMLDPTATLGNDPVVALASSRESEINSVAEMLTSRAIQEHVVDELGPETILDGLTQVTEEAPSATGLVQWLEEMGEQGRSRASGVLGSLRSMLSSSSLTAHDRAIEELKKNLEVVAVRRSNVICVAFEASQPQLAQRVVASVVGAYLEQHVRLNRTRGTHEFFGEHTKRLGDELKRLEDELGELKTTTGLASVDEQRTQIVTRMGRLEDELLTVETARVEAEAEVSALRESLSSLPKEQILETSTGLGNVGTDMIRDKFFALQVQEKEASALFKPSHPKLQMLREELAEAEQILSQQESTRTEVKTAPDATYEQTRLALNVEEPKLASLKARAELLTSQLADVRGMLEKLNTNEIRITRLTREIELHDADYRKYATNLEQARIDHAMEAEQMSNISVVQPASLEPRAIRPRKALNLLLGLVVAIAGAFSVAMLAEYLDRSADIPDDTERRPRTPGDPVRPAHRRQTAEATLEKSAS